MNLEELLGRVKFGTALEICDADTGERIIWRVLPWYANIQHIFTDICDRVVVGITVKEGGVAHRNTEGD